ncbi:hypothetical protein Tco_0245279 [Tanacetum coccineum]
MPKQKSILCWIFKSNKMFLIFNPSALVPNSEALTALLQRVSVLEKDIKELKQVDHTPTILKSIKSKQAISQTHIEELFHQVSQDDVSKFIKVKQELATTEKMPKYSTTPYDQAAKDEHKQKETLFQMMMASKLVVDLASQRKRWHEYKDQDPPVGSDQGIKKRRTGKDVEPSKKSSKSKEFAKGKTPSTTSKIGKFISIDKSVQEPEYVMQMDVKEPNLDNVADDADEPQADVDPKIPKKDWFK